MSISTTFIILNLVNIDPQLLRISWDKSWSPSILGLVVMSTGMSTTGHRGLGGGVVQLVAVEVVVHAWFSHVSSIHFYVVLSSTGCTYGHITQWRTKIDFLLYNPIPLTPR